MSHSPNSQPPHPPPPIPPPPLPLPPDSDFSSLPSSPNSSLASLPMSPNANASASIHTLPPLPTRSTPTTPAADPNRSCPLLSSPGQPSLTRHTSVPVRRLPLLDLNALPSLCPSSEDLRTPRRRVEAIGTALSRFRPYLFVGSDASARDLHALRKHNITHIVNLAGTTAPNYFESCFNYLKLSPRDDHNEPIDDIFDVVAQFIEQARRQQGACAVLCHQGISRSATVAIAYVMCDERISMDAALLELRVARPIVAPNRGFLNALTRLDRHLRQGRRRAWLGVVTHCDDGIFIARQVRDERYVCADDACYILERPKCRGVVVWRGRCCADNAWDEGVAIATRMAERQKRTDMILKSTLTSEKEAISKKETGVVTVCCQASCCSEIEAEMRRASHVL